MTIRALIVDDEPLARRRVRALLKPHADVAIVGDADDGDAAVAAIRAHAPDVVFLDVQMPGRDGFAVLRALDPARRPAIVFTTAYDQYALAAFDVAAVDYLLKPYDRERFALALARVRERLAGGAAGAARESARLSALLAALGAPAPATIAVRASGRLVLLDPARITHLRAVDHHVFVHGEVAPCRVAEPLDALVARLRPHGFRRAHRAIAVNLAHVREIKPTSHGDATIVLRDGTALPLGRRHREAIEAELTRR